MTSPNPYAAPHAGPPTGPTVAYVPLGWRTTFATLFVVALTVSSFAMHGMQATFGKRTADPKELALLLVTGLAGLATVVTQLGATVFVLIWIHRASRNLRGLGRTGMRQSPAACVWSFFIPIASLWLPFAAMKEIWRASDPETEQGMWFASKGTPLVGIWWAAYLIMSFIGLASFAARGEPSSEGSIGLVEDFVRAITAVTLVMLMRGVEARQEAAAGGSKTRHGRFAGGA